MATLLDGAPQRGFLGRRHQGGNGRRHAEAEIDAGAGAQLARGTAGDDPPHAFGRRAFAAYAAGHFTTQCRVVGAGMGLHLFRVMNDVVDQHAAIIDHVAAELHPAPLVARRRRQVVHQ